MLSATTRGALVGYHCRPANLVAVRYEAWGYLPCVLCRGKETIISVGDYEYVMDLGLAIARWSWADLRGFSR